MLRAALRRLDPARVLRGRLGVIGFHLRQAGCLLMIFGCGRVVREIMATSGGLGRAGLGPIEEATGWLAVGIGLGAAFVLPLLFVRRLHDLGYRGGWWWLTLVPIVNIFLHLYVQFWPGKPVANRFGDAPRPERIERALGYGSIAFFTALLLEAAWRLHAYPSPVPSAPSLVPKLPRYSPPSARTVHDETMERFAEAGPRAVDIVDERAFRALVVGREVAFVGEDVETTMRFGADGELGGTFTQAGRAPDRAALRWWWRNGRLCRAGSIGSVPIPEACGVVEHLPGVGLRVELDGATRGTERWRLD